MINTIAMFPVLVTENLQAQKSFYENRFGFETQFFDAEFYLHMIHQPTGVQLAFMLPNHPSQPEFLHSLAGRDGMVISLEVENAQLAYEFARKEKLDITFDLKHEEFGVSHFMIKDPAGFVVDIVEHQQQG